MGTPSPPPVLYQFLTLRRKPLFRILLLTILSSVSYIFGLYKYNTNSSGNFFISSTSKSLLQDPSCNHSSTPHQNPPKTLQFEPHHTLYLPLKPPKIPKSCPQNFTHYCPCQDPYREKQFDVEKFFHRERHCPGAGEALWCLVPRPPGYRRPFSWPKSRDQAWFSNVPFKRLSVVKKKQNWVRLEGDRLIFPGGGTSFPKGVKGYVDELKRIVPLKSGAIRTVLDTGCGVASFGASLMDYNILTLSIAPRDIHEAQVQFALERGLPAMLGMLSTYRLPYPSRSFDMAHCSRCLVPWTAYGI